jgi:nucleotide-binding universal stress UspA family protein
MDMAFSHLLVPVDFGVASRRAIDLAVTLATAFGAKLELVHAFFIPPIAYASELHVPLDELVRGANDELCAMLEEVREGLPGARATMLDGDPRVCLAGLAKERGADAIVLGTHGYRGVGRALMGSVAERVVRTSPVPVLTTGGEMTTAFRHILVPTDFGGPAETALAIAITLASRFDAKVTLVHAYATPATVYGDRQYWPTADLAREAHRALDAAVAKTRERYPRTEGITLRGDAREVIPQIARERAADLVAMGTHGRRGLPRLILGSVAEVIVRASPVPVLTIAGT